MFSSLIGLFTYFLAFISGVEAPLGTSIVMALGLGGLFGLAVILFPVFVRVDGIRCYSFLGIYQTILWSDIAQVRRQSVTGLLYMVVKNISGWKEIWIPLYLSDMPKFIQAVRAAAGEDNLLVQELNRVFPVQEAG
ncbi:hypothetical protein KIH39_23850 [Telmatocola sphagniphila]|uniref:Uncharacterized protein n=1 Tax=Telmatocola sphagniphila TaxID=1123043 RepID=A0A8E6B788_9BACT|nr:hypothetical protein [Telmatocola sphagniphila]QVL31833.1 hypothetical protein KIH39_23850 [Telmatocola sphagniphila]